MIGTPKPVPVTASFPGSKTKLHKRREKAERLVFLITLAIACYLVLPPLFIMVWTSVMPGGKLVVAQPTIRSYVDMFSSSALWELAGNTLFFAIGSSIGGFILGSLMAWLVARTDVPGKKLAYAITFVGFSTPGMLKIIGWTLLLGENNGAINNWLKAYIGPGAVLNIQSMGGMIFVESLFWMPMVFLLMVGPFRSMDPSLEESAYVLGAKPWRVYRSITARLMLPSIFSAMILMFIRSIQSFEVPIFLGVPGGVQVLTSSIYTDLHSSFMPDYVRASTYGTVLVLFLSLVMFTYHWGTRHANRFRTVTGKGFRPRTIKLGWKRWLGTAFLAVMFIIIIMPVCYVIFASFVTSLSKLQQFSWSILTLNNYRELGKFSAILDSVRNSVIIALLTSILAVLFALWISWLLVRSRIRGKWVLGQITSIPLVYPGIVLSLATFLFYLYVPIPPIFGTIWIFVVAYVAYFTTYAMRYTQPALLQIHPELEESAKVSGARWHTVFIRILMPLLKPAMIGAWIFIFLHSVRELSIASLLYTSKTTVVATKIMDMWANGDLNVLCAFGTIVTLASVIVAATVFTFVRDVGIKS